jgi:hypothetical protein
MAAALAVVLCHSQATTTKAVALHPEQNLPPVVRRSTEVRTVAYIGLTIEERDVVMVDGQ